MSEYGSPTKEGYYWARLYHFWNRNTGWYNASDEWTIIQVKNDRYDVYGGIGGFWAMGDDYEHDDLGAICEYIGPIPEPEGGKT